MRVKLIVKMQSGLLAASFKTSKCSKRCSQRCKELFGYYNTKRVLSIYEKYVYFIVSPSCLLF